MEGEYNKFFPYDFRDLNSTESEDLANVYNGLVKEFMRVGPKGYFAPKGYANIAARIYNMPIRDKDIFIVTYQRSGTTMMQELVWLLVKDFDYKSAKSTLLSQRYNFLELPIYFTEKVVQQLKKNVADPEKAKELLKNYNRLPVETLAEITNHRFIKTHLPLSFLPPKLLDSAKVIYVARDPRDVAVSSYHQTKLFATLGFQADFAKFRNLFIKNLFWFTPYFEHVKEAWAQRSHPNMLFLFFEDLVKDLPTQIRRVAKFLGKEPTEDQVKDLCNHLHIDSFKNNKSVNFEEMRSAGLFTANETFIRNGQLGGWRDYFNDEMTEEAESWIVSNLRNTDLQFPST